MNKSTEDLVLRSLFMPRQLDLDLKERAKNEKKSKSELMREILKEAVNGNIKSGGGQ